MTAREYLMRAWQAEARVMERLEERDRLRKTLEALERDGGQAPAAREAVAALEAVIDGEIQQLCRVKREVNDAILLVGNGRCRWLLELRYRNYMTWQQIAREMEYELRHVYRLHREGLSQLEKAWDEMLKDGKHGNLDIVCHPPDAHYIGVRRKRAKGDERLE